MKIENKSLRAPSEPSNIVSLPLPHKLQLPPLPSLFILIVQNYMLSLIQRARNNTTAGWENKQEAGPGPRWFSILQLSNDHVHPAMSERAEEEDEIPRLTTTHRIDEMDGNTDGPGRPRFEIRKQTVREGKSRSGRTAFHT